MKNIKEGTVDNTYDDDISPPLDEGETSYTSGTNNFGSTGYGGPMPPEGHGIHHYFFWILALNIASDLEAGLSMEELLKEMEPNVIGMNRLVGTYSRD